MYIYRQPYPNELYHHGVKGQKWGVEHGPPYPLYEGHGTSKAVMESKAKYGKFSEKRAEKGHHSQFEKHMARKEKKLTKKADKLEEKAEKTDKDKRKDRLQDKASNYRAKLDSIESTAKKYYDLDKKEKRKVDRGYAAVNTMVWMSSLRLVGRKIARDMTEAKAIKRIDEYDNKKKHK